MEGAGPSRQFSGLELNAIDTSQRSGPDARDYDTPRDEGLNCPASPAFGLPAAPLSPQSVRKKTKARASRALSRHDSLKEAKVLLVTEMRRSESVLQPELFQYQEHFEFLDAIGKTKFSEVYRVRHRQSNEIFAVKRSRRGFRTKLQRERCLREIRAVSALPAHPNIVGQYRAWQEGGHFYIQMDYCEGGSLNQAINPRPGPLPLTTPELWGVAADVAAGLDFLHSHDVLHLDIKPENLYRNLKEDGEPGPWRIGDFGLAVAKESKDWEEGDGDYVAPELLRAGADPTSAADVFSLGATLYECATGEKLPRQECSAQAADVVLPGRPEALEAMVRAMLLTNPAERPTAAQVAAFASACAAGAPAPHAATPEGAAAPQPAEEEFEFPAVAAPGAGPAARQRWVPSLSPLQSEGALTPGAAAGLMGLTPPAAGTAGPAAAASAAAEAPPRPPPLRLPPAAPQAHPLSSRTMDTNPGSFRLHRRDMKSPSMGSASESELYSGISCDADTGNSLDMDFPDTGAVAGAPLSSARRHNTLAVAWEARNLARSPTPGAVPARGPAPATDRHAMETSSPEADEGSDDDDPNTSVPQSLESSPSGSAPVSSRSLRGGIPRFPTLDSMASLLQDDCIPGPLSARDRLQGPDPPRWQSPFESTATGRPTAGAVVPPLVLPESSGNPLRRKRQHSSRRALVHALKDSNGNGSGSGGGGDLASSRSVDLCSSRSLQELMPVRKGARRGGTFHPGGEEATTGVPPTATPRVLGGDDGLPRSGNSTQRSARGGALSARLATEHAAPCSAAAAAAHMTNMTLDDTVQDTAV